VLNEYVFSDLESTQIFGSHHYMLSLRCRSKSVGLTSPSHVSIHPFVDVVSILDR
jgi:hypothetical protein